MAGPTRPPLEPFVGDLLADRARVSTLLAATVALFAAGLDPRIWAPQLTTVQAAVRAQPELETTIQLTGLAMAIMVLVGGAIGDLSRARPIIRTGLLVLVAASVGGLLFEAGSTPFNLVRVSSLVAASLVFPVALASVAVPFTGIARATAIGIGYGAYSVGQGVMPILLTLLPGTYAPGFLAETIVAVIALRLAWGKPFDLPQPTRAERPFVIGTALWASGIVAMATGLLWIGSGWDNPVRIGVTAAGALLLAAFLGVERWRRLQQPEAVRVERRPVTVALFAGLVIALAQNIPMSQLPNYFSVILGYGPLFGVVALVPLFGALVLAGPVAGWLLARYPPRALVGGGVIAVGLGNIVVSFLLAPGAGYPGFVLPLVAIGAGFVIASTVRTAIIFASVPRGLPATAASLNEASLLVGNRAGILLSTAIVGQFAMSALDSALRAAGTATADATAQLDEFSQLLSVLGTPAFASVAGAVAKADAIGYADAYSVGLRVALLMGGAAAVVGGLIAWGLLGRRDPLQTVYDLRDERLGPAVGGDAPA